MMGPLNETKILFPSQYGTYILFWQRAPRRIGAAREDGVPLRIIEAASIVAIQGGGVAALGESAPSAS
jgi:hypothetical protein